MAETARICPIFKFREFDALGAPLNGGKVFTYEPGTSIEKFSWTDSTKQQANPNPIVLDSYGRASVYLDGVYKIVVTDATGVIQYTVDNVDASEVAAQGGGGGGFGDYYGVDAGGADVCAVDISGIAGSELVDGMQLTFRVVAPNSGPATLNVTTDVDGATGAKSILKQVGTTYVELAAGDIVNGTMCSVVYDLTDDAWKVKTGIAVAEAANKVKVSAADTNEDYLYDKITVAAPLTRAITNPGADEAVQLGVDLSQVDANTVDNFHAYAVATANHLLALDANSRLPAGVTGSATALRIGATEYPPSLTAVAARVPVYNVDGRLVGQITGSALALRVGVTDYQAGIGADPSTVAVRNGSGDLPGNILGNADTVDGLHAASFAPIASPVFTGTPAAPTPPAADGSTRLATTAWLRSWMFFFQWQINTGVTPNTITNPVLPPGWSLAVQYGTGFTQNRIIRVIITHNLNLDTPEKLNRFHVATTFFRAWDIANLSWWRTNPISIAQNTVTFATDDVAANINDYLIEHRAVVMLSP